MEVKELERQLMMWEEADFKDESELRPGFIMLKSQLKGILQERKERIEDEIEFLNKTKKLTISFANSTYEITVQRIELHKQLLEQTNKKLKKWGFSTQSHGNSSEVKA